MLKYKKCVTYTAKIFTSESPLFPFSVSKQDFSIFKLPRILVQVPKSSTGSSKKGIPSFGDIDNQ